MLKPHSENPDGFNVDDIDHLPEELLDDDEHTYLSNIVIKKNGSNNYDPEVARSVFGNDIDRLNEFLLNYNTSPIYNIVSATKLINGVYRHIHSVGGVIHLIHILKKNDVYISIKLRAMLKIFCRTIIDGTNVGLGEVEVVQQYDDAPIFSADFCDIESYKNMTSGDELMRLYNVIGVRETIRYFATLLSVF